MLYEEYMKRLVAFLTVILIILSICPMTVFAAEEDMTMLYFSLNVDPRIKQSGKQVMIQLLDLDKLKSYDVVFVHYNNYTADVLLPQGKYCVAGGMISGDYFGEYKIPYKEFEVSGLATKFTLDIGDPNYVIPDSEETKEILVDGMIDREQTNKDRIEAGLPPIDWDKFDEEEWLVRDPDTEQVPDDTSSPNDSGDTQPSTGDTDEPDIPPDDEVTEEKTWAAILFVGGVVVVCVVAIYLRRKTADVFTDDE